MIITNFKEYLAALRDIFASSQQTELDAYAQDMLSCGQRQKAAKEKLQKEISLLNAKIRQLRQELSKLEDKTKAGTQIKRLKEAKAQQIRKLKQQEQTSRFAVLSPESKTVLCCLKVLRKYLTRELLENEFSQQTRNSAGNVIFNRKYFENSYLYQDAEHIRDYIAAYIHQHPDLVVSESYFNKMFDKESGWRGICHRADKFFEEQNKAQKKKSRIEIIAESRSDLELIKEYAADKVILVRLKTPEALDYEGSAAHNCVGGGSYDKLLNMEQSGIYSLRKLMPDGELKPVVTIEFNKGCVRQARGICNSFIAFQYSLVSRDVVMRLLKKSSQQELVDDKNISETVLNNIGLFRDNSGGYLDIHNLSGQENYELPRLVVMADELNGYEWDKLKIKEVQIIGSLSENVSALNLFRQVQSIEIDDLAVSCDLNLSDLSRLSNLSIKSKHKTTCRLSGQSAALSKVNFYSGNLVVMPDVVCSGLKKIACQNILFESLKIDAFPKLENLECNSCAEGLDISRFPNLQHLSLYGGKEQRMILSGTSNSLRQLKLGKVILADMSFSQFPGLQQFEAEDIDLTKAGFIPPSQIKCIYRNCTLNEAIVHSLIGQPQGEKKSEDSKVLGKFFDFSDITDCVDLQGLDFFEAETIIFSSSINMLVDGAKLPENVKIKGLKDVRYLKHGVNKSVLIPYINPFSVRGINYSILPIKDETENPFSRYPHIKELTTSNIYLTSIPNGIESLKINFGIALNWNKGDENKAQNPLDLRRLKRLKNIEISCLITVHPLENMRIPESVESIKITPSFGNMEKLDFGNYHRLKELDIKLIAPNLRKVILPDSLERINAGYSKNGIGITVYGIEDKPEINIEIPRTARPSIINYLQQQWGKDQVHLTLPPAHKTLPLPRLESSGQRR